ncbi:MAG: DEAD/DEAH box helicase, partial [Thermococci archaeon]|nr:DEAD/DEAH box helicase [Thermococci archaeon]
PSPQREDRELGEALNVPPEVAARLRVLWRIVEEHGRALIFTNTRQFAEILAHRLKAWGKPVEVHHGSLSREARVKAERALKEGKVRALICTSSMELGIDIGDVDVVVQYMSPRQVNRLVQRVGRARHRIREVSEGYVIATNVEDYLQSLVIAKHALDERYEAVEPIGGLDVLAHFIVGLLIERRRVPYHEPYSIARRAYVYRNLSEGEYSRVVNLLIETGTVGHDEESGMLYLRRGAFSYYYGNLSTIPDEVSWRVISKKTGRSVGRLDEGFVTDLEEGMEFVMNGRSWIVVEIDDESKTVRVRESRSLESAVPSWEGEMIPVPFEVASDVGRLKGLLIEEPEKAREALEGVEFRDEELRRAAEELRGEQVSTDDLVLIESTPKAVVVHADFGNRTNETVGRLIHRHLIRRYGRVFTVKGQAHAIVLKTPFHLNPRDVEEALRLGPEVLDFEVMESLRESHVFRWRLMNVAKRFGAIWKGSKVRVRHVDRIFEGTVVEEEALNELLHDKVDLRRGRLVLERIRDGKIGIERTIRKTPSRLARINMTVGGEFLLSGELERSEILRLFRKNLMEHEVALVCTNCGWNSRTRVERLTNVELRRCPVCGSAMLAVSHPLDVEPFLNALKKVRRGLPLEGKEERAYAKLVKAADLIKSYGFDAVLALASYGTGPDTAARILGQHRGDDLLVALMEREREFIRTRRFWMEAEAEAGSETEAERGEGKQKNG